MALQAGLGKGFAWEMKGNEWGMRGKGEGNAKMWTIEGSIWSTFPNL
jgi:hypothetical protein